MSDTIYKQPGKPPFMAFLGQRYMETVKNKQTNPFIFRVISQSCFTNLREDTKPLVNYTAFYFLFWLPLCYKSRGVTSVVISLSERKNVCFDQKHTLHLFTGFVKTMHNSKPATEKDQTHFSLSWVSCSELQATRCTGFLTQCSKQGGLLLDFKYSGDKPENNKNSNKSQLAQENLKKKKKVIMKYCIVKLTVSFIWNFNVIILEEKLQFYPSLECVNCSKIRLGNF